MKQKTIGIIAIAIILGSVAAVQATVTLSPKTPASTDKVVILMFNDGWLSTYTNALPILQSYGYKASFAIYPKAQDGKYSDYMSWAQVEALSKTGYDIQSHTYSHMILTSVSASILQSELVNSKQVLLQHGIQAGALIYPEGENPDNANVKQAIKNAGYLVAAGGTTEGIFDVSNVGDYYAIPSYTITDSTSLPYFESLLYGVSGSNVAMLVYQKVSDATVDSDTVTVGNFQQQMTYLHDNGFTVKTLSDVFFDITPLPTATPTPAPTATPTPTPTPTPVPTPIPTPTPTATPTPTPVPTASPTPTPTPTAIPTPNPTTTPTPTPSTTPTSTPTPTPTITSTPTPTPAPTSVPTPTTTPNPTAAPTAQPTTNPTPIPEPTTTPSANPTVTETPSSTPTAAPTANPTSTNDISGPQANNEISSGTALAIVGCSAVTVLAVAVLVRMYAAKKLHVGITRTH